MFLETYISVPEFQKKYFKKILITEISLSKMQSLHVAEKLAFTTHPYPCLSFSL